VLSNLSSISRPLCAIHRTQQILFSQTFEPNDLRLALPDFFLLMCAQGGHVRRTRLMMDLTFDTHRRRHKTGPSIQLDGTGYLHDLALQYMHRYSATFGKSFTRTNPSWLVNVSVWSALCAWATPKMRWLPVSWISTRPLSLIANLRYKDFSRSFPRHFSSTSVAATRARRAGDSTPARCNPACVISGN